MLDDGLFQTATISVIEVFHLYQTMTLCRHGRWWPRFSGLSRCDSVVAVVVVVLIGESKPMRDATLYISGGSSPRYDSEVVVGFEGF